MQLTQLTPSNSAQNPSIFKFGQNEIRVFEKNHEPWFSAFDIAKCLGLQNVTRATASLRDSERSNLKLERGGYLVIVSESGLYTMILRSDSAIKEGTPAFNFRVWVTDDLLPTLRKTGQYSTVRENRTVASLTPAQQLAIQQAVGRRAQKTANHYQTIYRAIKLRYQIARYDQLPQNKLEDCLNFIKTVDLRVPEKPKPVTDNRHPVFDNSGCCPCCGLKPVPEGAKILTKERQRALFNQIKPLLDEAEKSMRTIERERSHAWTCYHELRLLLIGIC